MAALFKWSKFSAAFGVWITNPITSPFIYGITYIVGAKLLGLKAAITLPEDLTWRIVREMLKNAPAIFGALTVGGILIGVPLSILSYFLSYSAVNTYQQRIKAKECKLWWNIPGKKERRMAEDVQKMIVVPVDGSENSLKALDYINLVFGPQHNLKTTLFYVLPKLPSIFLDESRKAGKTLKKLKDLEIRHTEIAEHLLAAGKKKLLDVGFSEKTIGAVFRNMEVGIARDIVNWSEKKSAHAVILATHGRSKLVTFSRRNRQQSAGI